MPIESRRELARAASLRYARSTKKEKGTILDEFCANTGLTRKYALRMLRRPPELRKKLSRHRRRLYGEPEQLGLRRLWPLLGYCSAKRLVAGLPDLIDACERHGEWAPASPVKEKLLRMSASTCERLLRPIRRIRPKGLSLTRGGSFLRSQIAVRLGTEWDDAVPGFVEGDLVEHCGGRNEGSFLYTLTLTDVSLGWTELTPIANKGQIESVAGLELISRRMPVPLKGVDFDNGSEFMNHHMKAFCAKRGVKLTRGRPFVKNDGCRVEQKNGAIVRKHAGYGRLETPEQLCALKELYSVLRLLINFFEPSSRLSRVQGADGRSRKVYDAPKSPYRRAIESEHIEQAVKGMLEEQFLRLNPVALRNRLKLIKRELLGADLVRILDDATGQFECDS